jgi:hypothetical protein
MISRLIQSLICQSGGSNLFLSLFSLSFNQAHYLAEILDESMNIFHQLIANRWRTCPIYRYLLLKRSKLASIYLHETKDEIMKQLNVQVFVGLNSILCFRVWLDFMLLFTGTEFLHPNGRFRLSLISSVVRHIARIPCGILCLHMGELCSQCMREWWVLFKEMSIDLSTK